jgi:hypothetical protein
MIKLEKQNNQYTLIQDGQTMLTDKGNPIRSEDKNLARALLSDSERSACDFSLLSLYRQFTDWKEEKGYREALIKDLIAQSSEYDNNLFYQEEVHDFAYAQHTELESEISERHSIINDFLHEIGFVSALQNQPKTLSDSVLETAFSQCHQEFLENQSDFQLYCIHFLTNNACFILSLSILTLYYNFDFMDWMESHDEFTHKEDVFDDQSRAYHLIGFLQGCLEC